MYQFDPKTDKYAFVHDYTWNHPEMEGIAPMNCDAAVWAILDDSKTLEEQLAVQVEFKAALASTLPPLDPAIAEQITIEERFIPGLNESDPDVRFLVISPKNLKKKKNPGLVHLFGGGMIMGTPEMMFFESANYCLECNCVVFSVDYRLLPKWTYPAAVDDVEAVTNYIVEHCEEFRIDPAKLCIIGQSAGAYLAACASYRMKLRGKFQYAGQMLIYPVIDDMFCYPSSNMYYGEVWHPIDDQKVFAALLGPNYNRSAAPADAIPSHTRDFAGLPPTALISGDLDYGHDAIVAYAQGIMNEHIFCDLHVIGGVFHGFVGMASETVVSQRATREIIEHLNDFMTGKCVRH